MVGSRKVGAQVAGSRKVGAQEVGSQKVGAQVEESHVVKGLDEKEVLCSKLLLLAVKMTVVLMNVDVNVDVGVDVHVEEAASVRELHGLFDRA